MPSRLLRCLALAPAPSHAAAKIQRLVSPGGIEAWFVQDATVPLIAMEYAFGGGATQDPADKPGVGNMVASLLDEGVGRSRFQDLPRAARPPRHRAELLVRRGIISAARLRMLKDNKDEAFDLLRMALTSPRFDSADVERIRAQVLSGLRRDTTNPTVAGQPQVPAKSPSATIPMAGQANGTLESVPKIDAADMKDYVRRVLAKDTLRIAVVGDIDPATLGKLLDKTFGGLPAKANLTPVADDRSRQAAAARLHSARRAADRGDVRRPRHQARTIRISWPAMSSTTFSAAAGCRRGSTGKSARSAALPIRSIESLLWMEHSALFIGTTGTRADRAGETVDAIDKEIRRIAEEGPTQQELDEAKSYLKGSQMLALDTSSKLASALLQYQLDKLPIDYIEKRNAIVDAVTLDDAKKAARRLWGQGLLTVIVGRAPQAAAQPAAATPPEAN